MFKKATKEQAKLRLCMSGASGAGKTRSALEIAKHLGKRIAVIDTERGSASKYSDKVDFDVCEINGDYHPQRFMDAIKAAADAGYDVIILDSLSHAWNGKGGFLDLCDQEVKRMQARGGKADSFAAWKAITPIYQDLVQTIMTSPAHVISCLRAKQSYSKEGGKVQKLGLEPEFRDGFNFENDIEGLFDQEHNFVVGKTRCEAIDGKIFNKPGKEFAEAIKAWLEDGAPASPKAEPTPAPTPAPAATKDTETFLNLAAALKECKTNDDLATVVNHIKGAKAEKTITADEATKLNKIYSEVKAHVS